MKPTNRNYRATFILDQKGQEASIEDIITSVKAEITAVEGDVSEVKDLGRRDFARVTNPKRTAGHYVQVDFAAPSGTPAALKERLRLNSTVYRTYVETL
tara:strand:+ start:546 stop:842 length:297 start_codon:yes stop_codon:yes gene_type:complete